LNSLQNKNSKEIISEVERLSGGNLFSRDDLEILLDKSVNGNKFSILEELAFNAKYADSLLKIIQKKEPTNDETFFKKALLEYNDSMQKIKNCITGLLEGDEFLLPIFSDKYLQLSQQCLSNLNEFCGDLGYLKLHLNDLKREE
jgi:hypothetical protein